MRIAILSAVLAVLCLIAAADVRARRIPDWAVLTLTALAIPATFVFPEISRVSRLIGAAVLGAAFTAIAWLLPRTLGWGDVKLLAAIGAVCGLRLGLLAAALAILTAGCFGACLLIRTKGRRGLRFAFAPFLCAGAAAALLVGERILSFLTL